MYSRPNSHSWLHVNNHRCSLQFVGINHPHLLVPFLKILYSIPYAIFFLQYRTSFYSTIMADYILNSTKLPQAIHPFYPLEANIVGYLANRWSVSTLLGIFAGGWVVILSATLALVRSHNPHLPSRDKATILWFVLSTCTSTSKPRTFLKSRSLILWCVSWDHTSILRGCERQNLQTVPTLSKEIGYFAFNHANMPGKQDLFGQLWKEYSFSDSRYLTSESFVLCMETVTAVCSSIILRLSKSNKKR